VRLSTRRHRSRSRTLGGSYVDHPSHSHQIDPSETETAKQIWKTECATLMIAQRGCISKKLLRARERGEFISYSEWETEADIERYTNSTAHKQIVSHTRGVKGASAVVKLYDLVN
jgi:heme-degrading monooxygenase HmoA